MRLLSLYLGARDSAGAWKVSPFAKNVTDTVETLALENSLGAFQLLTLTTWFGRPGYVNARYTPPREIGVMVRYAFGSRWTLRVCCLDWRKARSQRAARRSYSKVHGRFSGGGMRRAIFPGWWQVVVAIVVQAASTASIFTAFSIIAVPLQGEFESSRTLVMTLITATVLVTGVVTPLVGTAMDRYSLRSLMLLGASFLAAGFFTLSFTTAITHAIVVYALFMALAVVLLGPVAASTLLARWFSRRRGFAMGIAASGTAIGGLLLPPLLQGLIDAFEWRSALRIFSAVLFVITVPAILFLTIDRPGDRNLHPDGEREPPIEPANDRRASFGSTMGVLREPNFWFISAVMGLMFAGMTALTSNLLPLVIAKGISAERGALLLSIFSVGNFGGKLLFAGVGDRIDLRLALMMALTLQACSAFGFLHADEYTFLAAASLLLGFAVGGILPLWSFLLARVFGAENLGRVMGCMSTVITVFNLSAPMLFGFAFDATGSYDPALIAYIVLLVAAMTLLPRIRTHSSQAVVKPALS